MMSDLLCLTGDLLSLAAAAPAQGHDAAAAAHVPDAIRLVVQIGVVMTAGSILLCIIRILRGPELADRVLAGDVLALQVVALVVLLTIILDSPVFIDTALVVAILGFASTVAFAIYIGTTGRGAGATAGDGDGEGEGEGEGEVA